MSDDGVWVIGYDEEDAQDGDRGFFNRGSVERSKLPTSTLKESFTTFVEHMQGVLSEIPNKIGAFEVTEIQFTAEVSAKGTVSLLGSGGEVSGSGGITVTFQKK